MKTHNSWQELEKTVQKPGIIQIELPKYGEPDNNWEVYHNSQLVIGREDRYSHDFFTICTAKASPGNYVILFRFVLQNLDYPAQIKTLHVVVTD